MTLFDQRRLTNTTLQLDIDGVRRGFYSDHYFENAARVLTALSAADVPYTGSHARALDVNTRDLRLGDLRVEAQVFTRRAPRALAAGVDVALALLRHATGDFDGETFIDTASALEVEAVHDGAWLDYDGRPDHVRPALKIRGRYRDFARLETPILGYLTRASRIATNVYSVLEVANGKPILFFPARFDLPAVQAVDGYAYWLAIQRYNADSNKKMQALVSTDAQGAWWGGQGSGTMPHSLIAAHVGDTAQATIHFARHLPLHVPRIALVDFNNDTVGDSLKTLTAFWTAYRAALESGDADMQRRFVLDGVRIDTSPSVRDVSLGEGDPYGISPKLIRVVRAALDRAWQAWHVPPTWEEVARAYCANVKIVATGGFDRARIAQYEAERVPVDVYGVGSSLLRNDSTTGTDFTMDIVRIEIDGRWQDVAKVGRRANDNPDLRSVDLSSL
jgi:nicotinate phosphoribosyltransferase